jgi:hypothetical protein
VALSDGLRRFARRFGRSAQQRDVLALLERVLAHQQKELEWRAIFAGQLNALLRRDVLATSDVAQPLWLAAQRFRLRSQNEEDGITLALLRAAGVKSRRFVEIGSGRSGGNSAILAFDFGWSGLMVDASQGKIEALRRALTFNLGVTVVQTRVTPAKFNGILKRYGYVGEVDFMSIDVDSVDYWLLDALTVCSPRVLVMEYNALFGPERAITLPAEGIPESAPKGYFGASLAAIERKAREKGYRLVHCEDTGVNAFFLRDDVAPEIAAVPVAVAFRPPRSRPGAGAGQPPIDVFALIETHRLPIVEV